MLFAVVIGVLYTVLILVMGMGELWEEFSSAGWVLGAFTVVLGLATFYITDILIDRLTRIWLFKTKKKK